jgi:hypothetical protein
MLTGLIFKKSANAKNKKGSIYKWDRVILIEWFDKENKIQTKNINNVYFLSSFFSW